MEYELVIIWSTGGRDIYEYPTRGAANKALQGMKIALGNQISYGCVRTKN